MSPGAFLSRTELEDLLAGAVRTAIISGGAAGDHTVTGIEVGDALRAVIALDPAHNHDLTPDSALGGAVTNALGEDGAGSMETAAGSAVAMTTCVQSNGAVAPGDLTSEFSITGADTINNGGGTDTSGQVLVVVYEDLTP